MLFRNLEHADPEPIGQNKRYKIYDDKVIK